MLEMLRDLILHKAHANAELIKAIGRQPTASEDRELREKLHHIIVANRFWLSLVLASEFDVEKEKQVPGSLADIRALYKDTHQRELEWLDLVREPDLDCALESSYLPGGRPLVSQAMLQVCLHSHGHRVQCASRLRSLGATPPAVEFIVWLKDRPCC